MIHSNDVMINNNGNLDDLKLLKRYLKCSFEEKLPYIHYKILVSNSMHGHNILIKYSECVISK